MIKNSDYTFNKFILQAIDFEIQHQYFTNSHLKIN